MKFNWGHAMALVMISFMIFIISMVSRVTKFGLIDEDYHQTELEFSQTIKAQNNFNKLEEEKKPTIEIINEGLLVQFPHDFDLKTKGRFQIIRPADSALDIKLPLHLDSTKAMLINPDELKEGLYNVTLDWEKGVKGFEYRFKKDIMWKQEL
jgi:hypothetical protein